MKEIISYKNTLIIISLIIIEMNLYKFSNDPIEKERLGEKNIHLINIYIDSK